MMRQMTMALCALPLLLATATATAQVPTTLHVSRQGDDANAGTAAAAQQRLRELRDDGAPGPSPSCGAEIAVTDAAAATASGAQPASSADAFSGKRALPSSCELRLPGRRLGR